MPFAKFNCVREVSSEDSNYPAENLIKVTAKKWRTKTVGEKLAYVVLELSEPYTITGIDIGNECSAFIEVLVGKTSNTNDFKEILVTCSFMTPVESKNSANTNRVRCFNKDALVLTAASEKWQFVKLICTQPFNKHIQYGISFIKLHVAEIEQVDAKKLVPKDIIGKDFQSLNNSQIGKFKLREDSPESESESSGALFKRWKASERNGINTVKHDEVPSKTSKLYYENAKTIPSIKRSTVSEMKDLNQVNVSSEHGNLFDILDRNREDLTFGKEICSENEKVEKKRQKLMEAIDLDRENLRIKSKSTKSRSVPKTSMMGLATVKQMSPIKKSALESGTNNLGIQNVKTSTFLPFNQLLKGKVIVISGIQNPHRSILRDKALAMGAKYRTDWELCCTHLICAFKNTPKYNQVKGKGKIVTHSWIEDCHSQKKMLPWRRYALDSGDLNQPESEEELLDESFAPAKLSTSNDNSKAADLSTQNFNSINAKTCIVSSGSDTEDEIKKVLQRGSKKTVFDETTEEEDFLTKKAKLVTTVKTGMFLKGVMFFICDDIVSAERKRVERCIKNNAGSITPVDYNAQYLISNGHTVATGKINGILVKPDWIYECNDMEMEVPIKKYLL